MKGGANNNDESVNVYIEFLLFTVILTTILSVFYMPIFKVTNPDGYRTRITRIFIFTCVLYYILKKKVGFSLEKMFRIFALLFIAVYLLYCIYSFVKYIEKQNIKSRPGALKMFLLFIGFLLIIAMRKDLIIEVTNMLNFDD